MNHSAEAFRVEVGQSQVLPGIGQNTDTQIHEVWGDTVNLKSLVVAAALSTAISLGMFYAGTHILKTWIHEPALLRAYAMLIGILGCLAGGALCAWMFKPMRVVVEEVVDDHSRMEVLKELAAEPRGLGQVAELPNYVRREMEELGLLKLFEDFEKSAGNGTNEPTAAITKPHAATAR